MRGNKNEGAKWGKELLVWRPEIIGFTLKIVWFSVLRKAEAMQVPSVEYINSCFG